MAPGGLTVIAPIHPERVESLRAVLRKIGSDIEGNELVPFPRLASVHFARAAIFDVHKDAHGRDLAPQLMFATDYDPPLDAHLDELLREATPGIDTIFEHCLGYPDGAGRTPQSRRAYLLRHSSKNAAFYAGAGPKSMPEILQEAQLRSAIEDFLDRDVPAEGWSARGPQEIRSAVQHFVRNEPVLAWAQAPAAGRSLAWRLGHYGWLIGFVLLIGALWLGVPALIGWAVYSLAGAPWWASVILALVLIAAPVAIFFGLVRYREKREYQRETEDNYDYIRGLVDLEDRVGQNPMTWLINLKPGWIRLFLIRIVMFGTSLGIRYVFTRGTLIGIPSVHFARWSITDDNRRLLFLSNFDGSWENYTGDFVDRAAWGLTAIWSNTVGFSNTRYLFFGGAASERHFKGTHRDNEPPTEVFYSAHKHLSLQNIYQNAKIRAGLWRGMDDSAAREWLRLL